MLTSPSHFQYIKNRVFLYYSGQLSFFGITWQHRHYHDGCSNWVRPNQFTDCPLAPQRVLFFWYHTSMNQSNLNEFFPSLIQKGYTVREINESCQRHQQRVAPDWFNGTYSEYMDAMHEFLNGLWVFFNTSNYMNTTSPIRGSLKHVMMNLSPVATTQPKTSWEF